MDIRGFFKSKGKEKTKQQEDEDADFRIIKSVGGKRKKKPRPRIVSDSDNEEEEIKEPVDKKSKIAPPSKAKDAKKSISNKTTPTKPQKEQAKNLNKTTPQKKKNRKEIKSFEEFFGSAPVAPPTKRTVEERAHPRQEKTKKKQIDYIDVDEESTSPAANKESSTDKKHISESPPSIDLTTASEPVTAIPDKPVKRDTKPVAIVKPSVKSTKPTERPKSATPPAKPVKPVSEPEASKAPPKRFDSYREYLNRGGPKAPGAKTIPEGATNCLHGLTFVFTGVGESIERDEAAELVKKYGGRVTTSLSKKTNYLVVGEGAGVSKLAQAKALNVSQIDEDELLELIRTRPERKGVVTTPTNTSKSRKRKHSHEETATSTTPTSKEPHLSVGTPTSTIATPTSVPTTPTDFTATPSSSFYPTTPTSSKSVPIRPKGPATLLWVDKYSPISCKNIIGQQGKRSNANKLLEWLSTWHQQYNTSTTKKPAGDAVFHKAALLSGPPGIGKTTTAVLACKELGYSYTELNASATRSKKSLQQFVTDSLSSHSMDSFITGGVQRHHVLIMDEVDGMAGNEDRGGVAELIQLIKTSRVPIICICNDRQQLKMRSLAHHCYDLKFLKPKLEQIKGPMMSVAFKEGIKIKPEALNDLIVSCNYDIRQVLHSMSMLAAGQASITKESLGGGEGKTSIKMSSFDVVRKVFQPFQGGRELTLREKSDLFFTDYSFIPLFVQENYLHIRPVMNTAATPALSKIQLLQKVSSAADSVAQGDTVSRIIRTDQSWQLLPTQAIFSSVLPGEYMRGSMTLPEFPQWLGNNSKTLKNDRILQQLHSHSALKCSCNKTEFLLEYSPLLSALLTAPLLEKDNDKGPGQVVQRLKDYDLTRDDWEDLIELNYYSGRVPVLSKIGTKVKTAFTKCYNKEDIKLPYSVMSVGKKRSRGSLEEEEEEEGEGGASSSGDEEDPSSFGVKALKTSKISTVSNSGKKKGGKKRQGSKK